MLLQPDVKEKLKVSKMDQSRTKLNPIWASLQGKKKKQKTMTCNTTQLHRS